MSSNPRFVAQKAQTAAVTPAPRWTRLGLALCVLGATLLLPASARAVACFSDISAGLTGADGCAMAWGDYDNDGDLDLLSVGVPGSPLTDYMAHIYRNNGGPNPTFTDIGVGLPGVWEGAVAWGDYDNDGDLDVLISGYACGGVITRVYRNSGGACPFFKDILAGLTGAYRSSVAWGDYDNDGDLDILLTGETFPSGTPLSAVYRNSGGPNPTFTNAGVTLSALTNGAVAWADYDNDGNLDILMTGYDGFNDRASVYLSDGAVNPAFAETNSLSGNANNSSAAWGDYDSDGDLDILLTGGESIFADADIHEQSAFHFFSNIGAPLVGTQGGSAAWGDYNNDGQLDVLVVGYDGSDARSSIHQAPVFADIGSGLAPVGGVSLNSGSAAVWGDYDSDGDLDVALGGRNVPSDLLARVYRNNCGTTNTLPQPPTNLTANVVGNEATFSWSAATDAETPSAGLSYNLRVGATPGSSDIFSPMADAATGRRRVVALGNTSQRTTWTITVPGVPFYWSVQSIDGSYAGSAFAAEQSVGVVSVDETSSDATPLLRIRGENPFSASVAVEFNLPEPGRVALAVYDLAGRLVRTLDDSDVPAGIGSRTWDGSDEAGRRVPSGLYVIRLRTASLAKAERVVAVR